MQFYPLTHPAVGDLIDLLELLLKVCFPASYSFYKRSVYFLLSEFWTFAIQIKKIMSSRTIRSVFFIFFLFYFGKVNFLDIWDGKATNEQNPHFSTAGYLNQHLYFLIICLQASPSILRLSFFPKNPNTTVNTWSKLVISLFLTKNHRSIFGMPWNVSSAGIIIPSSFPGTCSPHVTTFLWAFKVIWFSCKPSFVAS